MPSHTYHLFWEALTVQAFECVQLLHMVLFGVFSRRFSREKCPTLTVASFFSFFFVRPQTSSRMYHFSQTSLSITCTRQYSVYGEPSGHGFESLLLPETFSSNFFRHCANLSIFFDTVRPFFSKFLFVAKGSPFKFFDFLQQTEVSKSPKGPPFLVFRHYETVSKLSFYVFFEKFFQKNFYIF